MPTQSIRGSNRGVSSTPHKCIKYGKEVTCFKCGVLEGALKALDRRPLEESLPLVVLRLSSMRI
ncbi:hypothetical protein CR513_48101, partial [Mucuna pruriens]